MDIISQVCEDPNAMSTDTLLIIIAKNLNYQLGIFKIHTTDSNLDELHQGRASLNLTRSGLRAWVQIEGDIARYTKGTNEISEQLKILYPSTLIHITSNMGKIAVLFGYSLAKSKDDWI